MLRLYASLTLLAVSLVTACNSPGNSRSSIAHAADAVVAEKGSGQQPAAKSTGTEADAGPMPDADRANPTPGGEPGVRKPNLLGRIPVLEYHLIGGTDGRWQRSVESFRADLELLYSRGYRPISVSDLVDKRIDIAAGLSPVVFTFDDASPSQFRFIEKDGELVVDSSSAVGIWLDFKKTHADWNNRAVFCMLSGAEAGRSFFGDKGIEGQQSEWRHRKLRLLVDNGFELCNHTVWHANLARQSDQTVVDQIARLNLAIDSAVANYRVRTFALPLGEWPKQIDLAHTGSWKDARTGRVVNYNFDAVLQVSGGPSRSPYDPAFNPRRITRVQVLDNELVRVLDQLDRSGQRYVSDGSAAPR